MVIAGEQKSGKTTFCIALTKRFAKQGIPCLWFSVELPLQEFINLYGPNPPLFYLPRQRGNTVEWIDKKIAEGVKKFGTKIVFIDHLGLVEDEDTWRSNNAIDIIDSRIKKIRALALKYNVCIVGVSELNKLAINKGKRSEIKTGDLRGSARLGYTATLVLAIDRLTEIKKEAALQDVETDEVFIRTDMRLHILDSRRSGVKKKFTRLYMDEHGDIQEEAHNGFSAL